MNLGKKDRKADPTLPKVVMFDSSFLVGKANYEMKQVETSNQTIQYPRDVLNIKERLPQRYTKVQCIRLEE